MSDRYGMYASSFGSSVFPDLSAVVFLYIIHCHFNSLHFKSHLFSPGTFIMKVPDETLQLLDEHMLATQQLGFSPFKAAFELRITDWDEKLRLTQKVLDEWIECQK